MRDRTRNVIVGLTMLAALALCMYGIVLLGKFPGVGTRQYVVSVIANDAAGVSSGSKVELNGVVVGQSRTPYLAKDATGKVVVKIELLIDSYIEIPSSSNVSLARPATGVGQSYVQLTIIDSTSPKIRQDGTATLTASLADSGLIPKSVLNDVHDLKENLSILSGELTTVARDLHVLLAYTTPEDIDKADPNDPKRPLANASTVIIRLDHIAKSLEGLLGDQKLQGQVRDAVQNISDAALQLKSTVQKVQNSLGNVDNTLAAAGATFDHANKTIDAIGGAATQASGTLTTVQNDISRVTQHLVDTMGQLDKTLTQITEGGGTTGKLVNDPRLYEGLTDLSKSLKSSVDDLDFLINKWKDEGVNLHLK